MDSSKPPLTTSEALEHIDTLLANVVASNSLARFHPTRPLTGDRQGDNVVFLIQVCDVSDSSINLRSSLKALCHNASLQLVATQLKEGKMVRSTLANNIAAAIRSCSCLGLCRRVRARADSGFDFGSDLVLNAVVHFCGGNSPLP